MFQKPRSDVPKTAFVPKTDTFMFHTIDGFCDTGIDVYATRADGPMFQKPTTY
jgi:hypothetical protein